MVNPRKRTKKRNNFVGEGEREEEREKEKVFCSFGGSVFSF